jgi:hypothetical protein
MQLAGGKERNAKPALSPAFVCPYVVLRVTTTILLVAGPCPSIDATAEACLPASCLWLRYCLLHLRRGVCMDRGEVPLDGGIKSREAQIGWGNQKHHLARNTNGGAQITWRRGQRSRRIVFRRVRDSEWIPRRLTRLFGTVNSISTPQLRYYVLVRATSNPQSTSTME